MSTHTFKTSYPPDLARHRFMRHHSNLAQSSQVRHILRRPSVQLKLTVGAPNDKHEIEADHIADQVMQMQNSLLQRQAPPEDEDLMQATSLGSQVAPLAHRQVGRAVDAALDNAASVPPVVERELSSPGQPLDLATQTLMEAHFGRDFSAVRVHTSAQAAESAGAINALAYTMGSEVVFGQGQYAPSTQHGQRLLAHELTHVAQQSNLATSSPVVLKNCGSSVPRHIVQRQPASQSSDPNRFTAVHQSLFVDAPGTGSATLQPWGANTTGQITQQFKTTLQQTIDNNPLSVLGNLPRNTSKASAESTAIQVDSRIRTTYPQIGAPLSAQRLRSSVSLLTSAQTTNPDFINQWLANRLFKVTNIGNFVADETDANFQSVVQSLANDQTRFNFTNAFNTLRTMLANRPGWSGRDVAIAVSQERRRVAQFTWSDVINVLASRTGAFVETSQSGREIFLSPGLGADARTLTLIHELTHFYVHDQFKEWVNTTPAPRFYNEGFTEYLARQVMTPQQVQNRDTYQDRVNAIEQEVIPFVSLDDIARAYFVGEVWRIETQSPVAQKLFGEQTGLHTGANRRTEVIESASSKGIVQTVAPGSHWRFMNLAVDNDQPKPEHATALRQILTNHVLNSPSARVRFVGHTSTAGSADHNLKLARRRARAFYALARRLGVPETQLVDAAKPATSGEAQVNVTESNQIIHRALNRRVELFIL